MSSLFDDPQMVHHQKRRALTPYLKFIRNLDSTTSLETRIEHISYNLFENNIDWLVEAVSKANINAGISLPAIYLNDASVRDAVSRFLDAGNEIVVHGYRHTSYMNTPYETAKKELKAVCDRFNTDINTRPTGFHIPFMRCSPGTVQAAEEHGINWIVGTKPEGIRSSISFLEPTKPYDLQLFEQGHEGPAVIERLTEARKKGTLLLCHPNIHAIHDNRELFVSFLSERNFVRPSTVAADKNEHPGLLLDCFPPFQLQ